MITESILKTLKGNDHVTFLCIGTDRSTGDSFGPLTGMMIKDIENERITVLGTLDNPVHAKNLVDTIYNIDKNSYVVAIDASLGKFENIGSLFIKECGLRPGAALGKDLPSVGKQNIQGIVNICNEGIEFMTLQNTRLSMVYNMAKELSEHIHEAVKQFVLEGYK